MVKKKRRRKTTTASARKYVVTKKRCRGVLPDGSRCRKAALSNEDFCHLHSEDPARAASRREAARKGGSVPRCPELPEAQELTVAKCRQLLSACSEMLLKGEITPGVARSITALLREDRSLKEHGELMTRLQKLETEAEE